jgi:hypothetical protein
MVQVSGCLTQDPGGAWILTNATEPSRTRTPNVTAEELKGFGSAPLGNGTYKLMDALAYHPDSHKGHRMSVKGLLIRKPENRLNVTALEMAAPGCAP